MSSVDFTSMSPEVEAAFLRATREAVDAARGEGEPVAAVDEVEINGLPARVYTPDDLPEHAPVIMYAHGGGWVAGGLNMQDATCRILANRARAVVVGTTYRLAPEHPFPAAAEDGAANLRWVSANADRLGGDPERVVIMGSSSGANVVASACLRARDEGGPAVALQVLLCPVLDPSLGSRTYKNYGTGYYLTRDQMAWYWAKYLPDAAARNDPYAVPGCADLAGLPPTIIVTAEFDPLRDEGETYAQQLIAAGVSVTTYRAAGQIHGFTSMLDALADARVFLDRVADDVRERLG
jgi:acetyl esterase